MGHVHLSTGCPCCEAMFSLSKDSAEFQSKTEHSEPNLHTRLDLNGLDDFLEQSGQIESTGSSLELSVEHIDAEVSYQDMTPDVVALKAKLDIALAMLKETTEQLQSASFRLGFMESQLTMSTEKLARLEDLQSKTGDGADLCKQLNDMQTPRQPNYSNYWQRISNWFFGNACAMSKH